MASTPSNPAPAPDATPAAKQPLDWRSMRLWQIQPLRDVLIIAVICGLLCLGYILRPVTVPILLALALAYLFEPLVQLITRSGRIRRPFAATLIILAVALAVVVPVIVGGGFAAAQGVRVTQMIGVNIGRLSDSLSKPQDQELADRLPRGTWRNLRDFLVKASGAESHSQPDANGGKTSANPSSNTPAPGADDESAPLVLPEHDDTVHFRTPAEVWADYAVDWLRANTPAIKTFLTKNVLGGGADAAQALWHILVSGFYLGFTLFLTLFFFYFFCTGWGEVKEHLAEFIPQKNRVHTLEIIGRMDRVIAGFVRGRLMISLILMVTFSIGYWIIGVPAPLVMGVIVGILSIVPYLALVGVPVSIILLWLNPGTSELQSQWWWVVGAPCVLYWIVQATDDYIWTPLIQGKVTDMDMPSILFAVLAGGVLAGIYGVMIAIPTAACLKILLKEVFWPRFQAWSKGQSKDFLPISRT